MKQLLNLARLIFTILSNFFFLLLSPILHKSKNTIVIGGWFGKNFFDNSKALFEELNSDYNFNAYYFTRNKILYIELKKKYDNILYYYSLKSIYVHLIAKYHIIDQSPEDLLGLLSVGAKRIQLWHGYPFKKIKLLRKSQYPNCYYRLIRIICSKGFWNNSYVLSGTEQSSGRYAKAFGVSRNKIIISSSPRTRTLFKQDITDRNTKIKKILYAPTFRDKKVFSTKFLDLDDMNSFLEENGLKMDLKLHYADSLNYFNNSKYENIDILSQTIDMYEIIPNYDLIISDYSSVFLDFMIQNKPIILYTFDLEYYSKEDRGFISDFSEVLPSYQISSFKDLLNRISELIVTEFNPNKEYVNLKNTLVGEVYDISNLIEFLRTGKNS